MIDELMIDRLRQGLARVVGERGELFQEAVDAHVLEVEMQPDEAFARRAELLDVARLSRRRASLLVEAQHENAAGYVHVQGWLETVEAHGRPPCEETREGDRSRARGQGAGRAA